MLPIFERHLAVDELYLFCGYAVAYNSTSLCLQYVLATTITARRMSTSGICLQMIGLAETALTRLALSWRS